MKLSNAFKGISQLAFDTAPLIYFVEQHPVYWGRMQSIMQLVDAGHVAGVASTLALAEVLVQPLRARNNQLADQYEQVVANSHFFRLEPITTTVARTAADLRARHQLRIPDALHIATALVAGCDAFLTNDGDLRRVTELPVLFLDELEMDHSAT